jgi:hypothetical protein
VTLRYRDLESTRLHAGLGVRLIDEHTQQPPFGWTRVFLDVADDADAGVSDPGGTGTGTGGAWRELPPDGARRAVTNGGVIWFPWLERRRDARGRGPSRYRVRVLAEHGTPAYLFDREGVEVLVAPYDDAAPPAGTPPVVEIALLPAAHYPFAAAVPVLRGAVRDEGGAPVPRALVAWAMPAAAGGSPLVTDEVLSDEDGEFSLPLRRAPHGVPIEVSARRAPPPLPGAHRAVSVQLPADLSAFLTIVL